MLNVQGGSYEGHGTCIRGLLDTYQCVVFLLQERDGVAVLLSLRLM